MAIRRAASGDSIFTEEQFERALRWRQEAGERLEKLSVRKRQVLSLVAEGRDNKTIAELLHITVKTTAYHVTNILKKLKVKSRHEASAWEQKYLSDNLEVTATAFLLLILLTSIASADTGPQPPVNPDAPLDCGVWAYNPVRFGSNVNGQGEVSCLTNHSSLRVTAGLRDWTGRYTSKVKTCYNTSYCSVTATLSYSPGRQWQTDVSGYVSDISWQAYYATNWIAIP